MKYLFLLAIFILPNITYAASLTPTIINSPNDEISFNVVNDVEAYVVIEGNWEFIDYYNFPNGTTTAQGLFDQFIMPYTAGTYHALLIDANDPDQCYGLTVTQCQSADEYLGPTVTIIVNDSNAITENATSSVDQMQKNLTNAIYIFIITMLGMIWIIRPKE
jgi:hypothetical protein